MERVALELQWKKGSIGTGCVGKLWGCLKMCGLRTWFSGGGWMDLTLKLFSNFNYSVVVFEAAGEGRAALPGVFSVLL